MKTATTAKNVVFGMIITIGFCMLMGCDTDTVGQLFWIVLLGFGFICLGGRWLIINNRKGE